MYDEKGYHCEPIIDVDRRKVLEEVSMEMQRQVELWGVQEHPMYKHKDIFGYAEDLMDETENSMTTAAKLLTDGRLDAGECSWLDILNEEVLEARDEAIAGDPVATREELIQVAAVAMSAVMSLDREHNRCNECGSLNGSHKMSCDTGRKRRFTGIIA